MNEPAASTSDRHIERVRISCPGCGRNDWVSWPANAPTYARKCFNCGKTFELARKGGGH